MITWKELAQKIDSLTDEQKTKPIAAWIGDAHVGAIEGIDYAEIKGDGELADGLTEGDPLLIVSI